MKLPNRNKIVNTKNINLYNKKYKQPQLGVKPDGFWYGCNNDWYKWCKYEGMDEFLLKYIHKINLNYNIKTTLNKPNKEKLLIINNEKEFIKFDKLYGITYKKYRYIKWNMVSRDFGGIEICPHFKKFVGNGNEKYLWYWTWDVASGCIWNIKSIIKNTEPIYIKNNKGIYLNL